MSRQRGRGAGQRGLPGLALAFACAVSVGVVGLARAQTPTIDAGVMTPPSGPDASVPEPPQAAAAGPADAGQPPPASVAVLPVPATPVQPPAPAADRAPSPDGLSSLSLSQIHGFVSQGFIKSTGNNYLTESKRGSFEFTEVGINFTHMLTDRLRTGVQLFAREVGKVGDYRARIDWFYLDYRLADWLGVRAGRTKMPFGLYNEANDVDSSRVPILLPQSVYPILNRDILLALTGIEAYGYIRLGIAGALDYRLYGGTLYSDPPQPPPGAVLVDFRVPYVLGGRLMWEMPIEGLRIGGSLQTLRFETDLAVPLGAGMPPLRLSTGIPFVLWLASLEYVGHDLILAAEYGRWKADVEVTGQMTAHVTNERYYGMAAYRVAPWFTPGVYYSALFPDVEHVEGRERYQHDWAATLRFDINAFWLVKLEGHFMRGTADLQPELNGGTPPAMLVRDWALFLAKTTVYF